MLGSAGSLKNHVFYIAHKLVCLSGDLIKIHGRCDSFKCLP